jgi:VWFA-related protein
VVNRVNAQRIAFIAGMIVLGTCGACGQTAPLRDPSVAQKTLAPLSSTEPVVRDGLFTIDVVVTDAAGKPASDLAPQDFTLLDNGQPAKIRTLRSSLAAASERAPDAAPGLIFVLDAVNLSPQQLTQTENAIVRFLRRNNGRLETACFVYRLTRDGLFSSSLPTRDGDMLAKEIEQHRSPRTVWRSGRNSEHGLFGSWVGRSQRNPLSLSALGSIAIDQREIAGRKIVVWIGPGWPVQGNADSDFSEITELSTRLREARITLDSVTMWLNPEATTDYRSYLEPPRSQKDMQPAKMALRVIATHTGGLVLDSGDLDRDIERCVEEVRSFYTFTLNPPRTDQMDEYHDLRAQVARPTLTARAPTSYYNEPVYFDNLRPGIERVTVAQLEELVHSQTDLLRKLEHLELTERLSTPRLEAMLNMIRSERER